MDDTKKMLRKNLELGARMEDTAIDRDQESQRKIR